MKYFFVLGRQPEISLSELEGIFSKKAEYIYQNKVAVFDLDKKLGIDFLEKVGGTIKFGEIIGELTLFKEIKDFILDYFSKLDKEYFLGKFHFGFSDYLGNLDTKLLGLEIKKELKEKGISCRLVVSKEKVLSSVVVEQNNLLKRGVEINIIKNNNFFVLGRTLAVQPFKALSKRDYGRPARDDQSGMLPPKLAQVMLNLAKVDKDSVIFDPFCGSGTIVSEAALLGAKKIIGSDISAKAVADSKQNLSWLGLEDKVAVYQADATLPFEFIKDGAVDAIVTEPFLGEQRGRVDILRQLVELNDLYNRTIKNLYPVLKKGGRLVMIWPIFMSYDQQGLNPNIFKFRLLSSGKNLINKRPTLVYGRPNQKVWREIVILVK
jgi:tRNA G10  N-methylase Trm11